jgi:hypothetical protein
MIGNVHGLKVASTRGDVQAQNFPVFALHSDFKRPAANFAIAGETLRTLRRINGNTGFLAAERALNAFWNFHGVTIPAARPFF